MQQKLETYESENSRISNLPWYAAQPAIKMPDNGAEKRSVPRACRRHGDFPLIDAKHTIPSLCCL